MGDPREWGNSFAAQSCLVTSRYSKCYRVASASQENLVRLWSRKPRIVYPQLPRYAASDLDGMMAALHRDGFALIPGLLNRREVDEHRAAIDRLEPGHWDFTGTTDHYKNVFNRDPRWLPLLDQPGVIDLAEAALGSNCHIIGQTAWRSHPGHRGVRIHLDYLAMELPVKRLGKFQIPMFICTAHFYLCDITEDLCPTRVIPGSHRAARKPTEGETQWEGRLPQPVLCDAGDVLFFRSDLWHSGSENRTADQTRYLLQVHYARREMAQHFMPFLEWQFNPAVVAACSERQRRLLGDHRQGAYD